jgi:Glycosyl transferase family 2.
MNVGARRASGEVLLFLHADTRLPQSALNDIAAALSDSRYLGGRFDVELEGAHWMLKIVGTLINWRSRGPRSPLVIRRCLFGAKFSSGWADSQTFR